MASIGDQYVLNVQQWLNKRYNSYVASGRFKTLTEDGYIGWGTINGLIRALQIELGIQQTADNFGTGTINAFNEKYARFPEEPAIVQQADGDNTEDAVYGIIQGALLCKGYSTGVASPTLHFYNGTGNAIKKLKSDAGLSDTTSDVTLNVMKALLSMDYFVTYKTDAYSKNVRAIQQYLNCNYEAYIGIIPCDGVYQASTGKALMYGLQSEEGLPLGTANGFFGPSTKLACPTIPYFGKEKSYDGLTYLDVNIVRFTKLARIALYVNGFEEENGFSISGMWNDSLKKIVEDFQSLYAITKTGILDLQTWAALLVSTGDTSRSAIACDTATIITDNNIRALTDNGYKYIARYMSGTAAGGVPKGLSTEEMQLLFKNGIRLFPIHQGSANTVSYFTVENAENDAAVAYNNAEKLHLEFGSIIYFAVDCDPVDSQVTNYIIPYFKALHNKFITLNKGKYRVGIYGPRNVCTRVCNEGYACSSFVADMATGYSGNLGYPLPKNWALDQFTGATLKSHDGNQSLSIDKDGFSGQYNGISTEYSIAENKIDNLNTLSNSFILVNRAGTSKAVYSSKEHYDWPEPTVGTQYVTSGDKIGEIKPNEFYIFFGVSDPSQDTVHKVLFNDGTSIKMGYIDGTHNYPSGTNYDLKDANANQIPDYHEPYSYLRYNPADDSYYLDNSTNDKIITINKPVVYFTTSGEYVGELSKGDKITITYNNMHNTGISRPWCYRVSKISFNDGRETATNYYVSTGLEYGSSGSERAWY